MEAIAPVLISGIVTGSIYALVGMGLVAIYKCTRVLNFAQGELVLIGAYLCWTFIAYFQLPIWVGILLGFVVAAGVGVLIQLAFIRPLIGQPVFALIILTIGLSWLLRGIVFSIWGVEPLGDVPIFPGTQIVEIGGMGVGWQEIGPLVISLAFAGGALAFFKYSNLGTRMRATSEDAQVAQSLRVNVSMVFTFSWLIGSVIAAAGGLLLASKTLFNLHLASMGLKSLAVVFLGGLESFGGTFLAGITIGVAEAVAAYYLDPIVGGGIKEVFAYIVIVVILLFRPYGFAGEKEIERV